MLFEKISCKKVFEPIPPTGNTFNKQGKRVLLQWRSIKSIIPRLFHNWVLFHGRGTGPAPVAKRPIALNLLTYSIILGCGYTEPCSFIGLLSSYLFILILCLCYYWFDFLGKLQRDLIQGWAIGFREVYSTKSMTQLSSSVLMRSAVYFWSLWHMT